MDVEKRIDSVVDRLVHKMEMSQTPVPGFIVGLSGTDSIVAFEILSRGLARMGLEKRLLGMHYVGNIDARHQNGEPRRRGRFERIAVPWLRERYGADAVEVAVPLGGNHDPQRWADLQLRSVRRIRGMDGDGTIDSYPDDATYWVAGTINATEHALGKHSIGANAVSIQPIRSLWKTTVLEMCTALGVPSEITEDARLPDCLCGRDEIAAQHIELIDQILKYDFDVKAHDPELVMTLMSWIADRKREGGFRARIPYIV